MKKQKKPGGAALLRYLAGQKGLLALYLVLGPVNAPAEVGQNKSPAACNPRKTGRQAFRQTRTAPGTSAGPRPGHETA